MSLSTSLLSYKDCLNFMEKALEFKDGARIRMDSESACIHFRMRCQQARSLDREQNAKTYDRDDFMHGKSAYDVMTFRIYEVEGKWYVYAERVDQSDVEIEGLGEPVVPQLNAPATEVEDVEYEEVPETPLITRRPE